MSRALNRRLILNVLRQDGAKSRAELATITRLSPAAVTFVVSDLIDEGILIEGKSVASSTGRRPIPVEIDYTSGIVIGFKLMVGAVECAVSDLATTVLHSQRLVLNNNDVEHIVSVVSDAVPQLIAATKRPEARLVGVGISMPGLIDNERAVCVRSNRYDWDDVPLGELVARRINVPVWLEDDTNAYAIAQHLFGHGRHHDNMCVLAIGVGIACSLVIDGKVFRGAHGAAGKIGHFVVSEDGPKCECGKNGCLMAYYSEPAMVRRWALKTGQKDNCDRRIFVSAVEAGDPHAVEIMENAGRVMGVHLANIVNLIDPEVIVLGGEIVNYGEAFLTPFRERLGRGTFRTAPPVIPDWADDSWARGAAALVTQKLFDFETPAQHAIMTLK